MHPKIFRKFEQICTNRNVDGRVLEVGAVLSDESLLTMKCLKESEEKIGINLLMEGKHRDFHIVKGNANSMLRFSNGYFDTVLCNATLSHDPYFWRTLSEMKRVLKPGGLLVVGVLLYVDRHPLTRRLLARVPFFNCSTITFSVINCPGDFYRFSPQALEQVFMEGMKDVEVVQLMLPPRGITSGIKP